VGFGSPERSALQRHLPPRFGAALDVFVERARELAIQEKAWMSYARAMAEIGRLDEVRWAVRQLGPEARPRNSLAGDGCYSRVAALLLEINDFREADRIIGDAPCYGQRAEIAKRYAESGEAARAKEIAYEVLASLPDYIQAIRRFIDGPRLADTVHPLITALALAGDRERALKEMQEIERFASSEGRYLSSYLGISLGMSEVAQIYYEIGEEAKGDAVANTIATQDESTAPPSWSRPFARAYAQCASGKPNCLDALLSFSGETVSRETADQILRWAVGAGRKDITGETLRQKFSIANAWLLDYSRLSLEVHAGDEDAAARTLRLLIDNENRSEDHIPLLRCIFLLRLAVAMENRELATEAAKLILLRVFNGPPAQSTNENVRTDWESAPETRAKLLAEGAAVLAQLP
jgi:hypothetical protein